MRPDRLPADRLEERILSAILAELDDGSIFEKAAELGRADWEAANSGRAAEIGRLEKKIDERRGALDRYLKPFEAGRLSEKTCAYRVKEVEKELAVLEAEKATIEAQDEPPAVNPGQLRTLRSEIERTIREGSPQDVKALLADCLDSIVVDSRRFVQPFIVYPRFVLCPLRGGGRDTIRTRFWRVPESGSNLTKGCLPPEVVKESALPRFQLCSDSSARSLRKRVRKSPGVSILRA